MAPGRYDDTFGDLRNITLPVVGNHEGYTKNAQGYFDYWYGAGVNSGGYGDRTGGYYTTTIGSWRFIGLSSECAPYKTSGGCGVGSPQYRWLQSVLARNTAHARSRPITYRGGARHRNRPLSGDAEPVGSDGRERRRRRPFRAPSPRRDLQADRAFGCVRPAEAVATGIRSFTVGTGGASQSTFTAAGTGQFAALDARARGAFGALRIELRPPAIRGRSCRSRCHHDQLRDQRIIQRVSRLPLNSSPITRSRGPRNGLRSTGHFAMFTRHSSALSTMPKDRFVWSAYGRLDPGFPLRACYSSGAVALSK